MIKLSDFAFPVDTLDFRMFVQAYLNRLGRKEARFKNNLPGLDFVSGYLKRHKVLAHRFSMNVKKARMAVNEEMLSTFIEMLSVELDGIPPHRIYNYDETNLTDDPGKKKVICRRGTKYVERFCNSSKTATLVMFCGNGDGSKFLPPYVVYKSECLWSTWEVGGPTGTRYNRTRSGWFESHCFEDWFESHFLRAVRHEEGPVALIGDNLASHLNSRVLELCEARNIKFICLPPNATHICQPLDVAVYRPLKGFWRKVLSDWKESDEGKGLPTLPKHIFPTLLSRVMDMVCKTVKENLISGFRKCGIVPLDKEPLLQRLNERRKVDITLVGESFLEVMDNKLGKASGIEKTRKKKLNVPAGKGITPDDLLHVDSENGENVNPLNDDADPVSHNSPPARKRGRPRKSCPVASTPACSDSESLPEDFSCHDSDSDETFGSLEEEEMSVIENVSNESGPTQVNGFCVGEFVIVLYTGDGVHYPGIIESLSQRSALVKCMTKKGNSWFWPSREDTIAYEWRYDLRKIEAPKEKRRGMFNVPELNEFM